MDLQTSVYQPQMMIPTPVQQPYAVPVQPVAVPMQQYVVTDASGQQVILTGAAQSVAQPVLTGVQQPVVVQQLAPAAQSGPAIPVWMLRAGFGVLVLAGGAFGLQFLAGALDHLVHALSELIRLLVTLLVVLAGGAVGLWVLKNVLAGDAKAASSRSGESGGMNQTVTTNVAVSLVNQVASGRRGRNNA